MVEGRVEEEVCDRGRDTGSKLNDSSSDNTPSASSLSNEQSIPVIQHQQSTRRRVRAFVRSCVRRVG